MKNIKIQIPDGKKAEWVNGVLTLVDEKQIDNLPITERVKTFDDACDVLGDEHPFVNQYRETGAVYKGDEKVGDFIAYLKLRIIVAALNEGWEPQFTEDEYRYFPWFYLYTKEEHDEMDEDKKRCHVLLRSGSNASASCGFVYVLADYDASHSCTSFGSRLAFRTSKLARYAGEQFAKEWADFLIKANVSN